MDAGKLFGMTEPQTSRGPGRPQKYGTRLHKSTIRIPEDVLPVMNEQAETLHMGLSDYMLLQFYQNQGLELPPYLRNQVEAANRRSKHSTGRSRRSHKSSTGSSVDHSSTDLQEALIA